MGEELYLFGAGIGMIGFPFAMIFIIFYAIKWNEKKNLFSDSWFAYLGWVIGGIAGFLAYFYAAGNFPTERKLIFTNPIILVTIFQTCVLSLILYLRCRPKKEFSLQARKAGESGGAVSASRICQTAFLVSVLTSLMMWGLFIALESMQKKTHLSDGFYH